MNYSNLEKPQFETAHRQLVVNAPAKLNLYLLIAGKRPDGYHEIDTVMSKISWYDQVAFEKCAEKGVFLNCKGEFWAPENEDNLIIKASQALEKATGFTPSVKITLIKNIPAGTGLGSASSDAAATLLGLNKLYDLGLSGSELASIAAQFGSDTAFFTSSPVAQCKGRGEILTEIQTNYNFDAIVIIPNISVSTVSVYKSYKHDAAVYEKAAAKICPLMAQGKLSQAASLGINMLAKTCFELNPELGSLAENLSNALGKPVVLSGSGSAFYAIIDKCLQESIEEKMRFIENRLGCKSILVSNNRW